jgi:site-specific recombinase XerD
MNTTPTKQQLFIEAVTVTLSQWIDGFLLAKRAEGVGAGTLRKIYAPRLAHFVDYCAGRNVAHVEHIDAGLLREYLLHLEEAGHNAGGQHQYYRVLKTFLRWYEAEAETDGWRNPIRKVPPPKVHEEILEPVELDNVARLIVACDAGRERVRDKAIFLTLLDTGARASELCHFDLADFDAVTSALLIHKGKGGKSRTVFLGRKARKAVRVWVKERGAQAGALFCTEAGGRMTYFGLRSLVTRRSRDAGIAPAPSLHSFRRAFALAMLRNGTDLLTLQRLLGHADLSVLKRYVKQTTDDLQAAHAQNSPVDRNL